MRIKLLRFYLVIFPPLPMSSSNSIEPYYLAPLVIKNRSSSDSPVLDYFFKYLTENWSSHYVLHKHIYSLFSE